MNYSRTRLANVVQAESGTYFLRAKVHGSKVFKSLRTKSIEIAALKRDKELIKRRGRLKPTVDDAMTVGELVDEFLSEVERSTRRAGTKQALRYTKHDLKEACPRCLATKVTEVNSLMVRTWMDMVGERYCVPIRNKVLGVLKKSFKIAVDRGQIYDNPADCVKCQEVPINPKAVPTDAQLKLLFETLKPMRAGGAGAYFLASFLCYSGFRVGTVRQMTPANVERQTGFFVVPGEWLKTGVPGREYRFPILPKMAKLLDELDERYGKERAKLLPTASAILTLQKTCDRLKMPRLNHHSFRHIFTTSCILSGVPVPIIAQWRGDRDGGKTLLRVYWHLIDEQSKRFAAKVQLP